LMSAAEMMEALREVKSKLDAILARLWSLEGRILKMEEPEPEDVEAYLEAEKELREGALKPFTRT